ncbi:MAG: iron ABC transporter permease [SAR324 cluster bacterium]|nr:iron ABC transporter permease [SAR324 cluster bacterium]
MKNITSRLWLPSIIGIALILSVPILTIAFSIFEPPGENWQHLKDNVLKEYIGNSILLTCGVGIGTLLIGVSTAWLTTMCSFPGKNLFVWILLLPLAMPAYIVAYTYTGMFDFAGPVQTMIRDWTDWSYRDYYFPQIRSMGGAITMLSLVLYPYVYLLGRSTFLEQSVGVMEVSRSLDCGPWTVFYKVALPLARPAIVTGLSLALMETLADYGTVAFFGLGVFTTGIFRTWFGLGDYSSAAKLASLLLFFVFVLIIMERVSRKKARYHNSSGKITRFSEYRLKGLKAWVAFATCAIPVFLGFLLPAGQLSIWALDTWREMVDDQFFELVRNSFLLGFGAALISVILALFLGYGKRIMPGKATFASIRMASIGYAIPGTVVAVGVIIPFAWLDGRIDTFMQSSFGISSGLILSGTIVAVIFAYVVRFLAISLQTVESGLEKIKPSMDDAARSLGCRPGETLYKIHIPLMKSSTLTAMMIVFVDVMKELPATLILRPFDFNTLAVRAFELASDERLADSSTAALTIVLVGLVPVIYLSKTISHSRLDQGNTKI